MTHIGQAAAIAKDACDQQPLPDRLTVHQRQQQVDRSLAALYRWYVARSQPRRNWNADVDFDWANIGKRHSEPLLRIVQGFYAVEQFVPDYTAQLVGLVRKDYGRSQFYLRWGAEEAKHSDLWRNVLLATGYRDLPWLEQYTDQLRERSWTAPFDDPLEMLLYTVFQERATQVNYQNLRLAAEGKSEKAELRVDHDPVLVEVAKAIANDELAHFEFYLAAAQIYLYYFPERTLRAMSRVLALFQMPAADIIPDYGPFIDALYGAGLFGRRIYVRDVVQLVKLRLGVRDAKALERHIKAARPQTDPANLERLPGPGELFDFEVVQHSMITLFLRLCRFEQETGLAEQFATGLVLHFWNDEAHHDNAIDNNSHAE